MGFTLVEIMIVVMIIGLLAAIALPGFARAREASQRNACINNMRMIQDAKDQYAIEEGQASTIVPNATNIDPYIRGGVPVCPVGDAVYDINAVNVDPSCTSGIDGHVFATAQ